MSQKETTKKFLRGLGISVCALFIAMTYNNCGKQGFYTERAYVPVTKLQQDLKSLYSGQLKPSICADSTQYVCSRKIFSEDVEYSQMDVEFPCEKMADGSSLCVGGQQYAYNTSAAAKACQAAGNCTQTFEYEEFHCYFKLPDHVGSYPIEATADDFSQAVGDTHAACLRVVGDES